MDMSIIFRTELLDKFGRLRRKLNLRATLDLKPLGIGPKQALIIRELKRAEVSSLADLARSTATDPAALGRAIDTLIKKEWVAQREHPSDRRRWNVHLTKKGYSVAAKVDVIYGGLAEKLLEALTASEQENFSNILSKILTSVDRE